MIGQGTAYQRGAFGITTLLTGQLMILFIRRRTIVIVVLLAAVFVVAGTFTWNTSSSDQDMTLIVVWCLINGAVAGILRAAMVGIYPTLFGRGRLDSVLLHANLWDSVGATLGVLVADWLCLVIRAWLVIFAAGLAAVGYAGLECTCTYDRSDSSSGISGGSDAAEAQEADRESLASVCISPSEAGSLSTVSSNRFNVVLRPSASRAYYTFDTSQPAY